MRAVERKGGMWGIIPAAGAGSRIQPLAFSKELLPVGSRQNGPTQAPRAVAEYLVERMVLAGVSRLCFIIAPGKADILHYFGGGALDDAAACFVVQPRASGLCDAIFRAAPFIGREEMVCVGLPDTLWFPANGLCALPDDKLAFLLFPVAHPELFDAVVTDGEGNVREVQVKKPGATAWIWGAFKMPSRIYHELHGLWLEPGRRDEYFGTLVNAWLKRGGSAVGIRAGESYVDVGTVHGYREAVRLLSEPEQIPVIGAPAQSLPPPVSKVAVS